jgi:GH25 family lysozyme M1 (1,4-beta-N-acetylmuramidase)
MAAYVRGVDLSRYQSGRNDFGALHRGGYVFAVQRWGVGNYRDPTRVGNLRAIAAAGLVPGVYHVPGEHTGSGTAQARRLVDEVRGSLGDRPMLYALDAETSPAWGDPTAGQCAEFCAEVRRLTGHRVLGYVPRWWMQAQGWTRSQVAAVAANAVWWQSQYRDAPDLSRPPVADYLGWPLKLWQWSATGPAPGIPGNCDKNVFYGSLDELRRMAGGDSQEEDMPITEAEFGRIRRIVRQEVAAGKVVDSDSYLAKPRGSGQSGPVYSVANDHTRKILLPRGDGSLHEWVTSLRRLAGLSDRAVEIDQDILDQIPTVNVIPDA